MKQQNWEFSEGADRLQGNTASGWSFPTFSIVEKLKTHLRISSLREQDRRVKESAKTDGLRAIPGPTWWQQRTSSHELTYLYPHEINK